MKIRMRFDGLPTHACAKFCLSDNRGSELHWANKRFGWGKKANNWVLIERVLNKLRHKQARDKQKDHHFGSDFFLHFDAFLTATLLSPFARHHRTLFAILNGKITPNKCPRKQQKKNGNSTLFTRVFYAVYSILSPFFSFLGPAQLPTKWQSFRGCGKMLFDSISSQKNTQRPT